MPNTRGHVVLVLVVCLATVGCLGSLVGGTRLRLELRHLVRVSVLGLVGNFSRWQAGVALGVRWGVAVSVGRWCLTVGDILGATSTSRCMSPVAAVVSQVIRLSGRHVLLGLDLVGRFYTCEGVPERSTPESWRLWWVTCVWLSTGPDQPVEGTEIVVCRQLNPSAWVWAGAGGCVCVVYVNAGDGRGMAYASG